MKNAKAIFSVPQQTQQNVEEKKELPVKIFRFPSIAKNSSSQ